MSQAAIDRTEQEFEAFKADHPAVFELLDLACCDDEARAIIESAFHAAFWDGYARGYQHCTGDAQRGMEVRRAQG